MNTPDFPSFNKIARHSRDIVITEKLDGTNALVHIERIDDPTFAQVDCPFVIAVDYNHDENYALVLRAGSRVRWIRPKRDDEKGDPDNYGFAKWVSENRDELFKLGEGAHYGEWWGHGIGRKYAVDGKLQERKFSLFNVHRWSDTEKRPACCDVVPVLYKGGNFSWAIATALDELSKNGSVAAPGFMDPEGIVIFHTASQQLYKKFLKNDELPKGIAEKLEKAA